MSKTVQAAKNSLKFKVTPKSGLLTIGSGAKKFKVPLEVRLLSNGKYVFLSFAALSELFVVEGKELTAMESEADGSEAYSQLNPATSKATRRKRGTVEEIPDALKKALASLGADQKLVLGPNGYRVVRKRSRRSKKS